MAVSMVHVVALWLGLLIRMGHQNSGKHEAGWSSVCHLDLVTKTWLWVRLEIRLLRKGTLLVPVKNDFTIRI